MMKTESREQRIKAAAQKDLAAFVEENAALTGANIEEELDDTAAANLEDIQMELQEAITAKEKAQQEVLRIAGEAEKKQEMLAVVNAELASVKEAYEGLQKSADTMSNHIASLEKELADLKAEPAGEVKK
jgi:chromosome segregation ATPase